MGVMINSPYLECGDTKPDGSNVACLLLRRNRIKSKDNCCILLEHCASVVRLIPVVMQPQEFRRQIRLVVCCKELQVFL